MSQVMIAGLDDALLRVEQARNAIARAKKRNGGMLSPDQDHLLAELEAAQRRLDQVELQRSRQMMAAARRKG